MWTFGYLQDELGCTFTKPVVQTWDGLTCMVGHGDGLGPGDRTYNRLKRVFTSRACQAAFRLLPPRPWHGPCAGVVDAESPKRELPLSTNLSQEHLRLRPGSPQSAGGAQIDAFIFGHRHHPVDVPIAGHDARYINTGDWLTHFSSVVIQDGRAELIHHTPGA